MGIRLVVVLVSLAAVAGPPAVAQTPSAEEQPSAPGAGLLVNLKPADLVRVAGDFQQGAASLAQAAGLLDSVAPVVAEAVVQVSDNMARMSAEFDPFGFKAAFQTIDRQNKVIQQQQATIQELQQREIERLQAELDAARQE